MLTRDEARVVAEEWRKLSRADFFVLNTIRERGCKDQDFIAFYKKNDSGKVELCDAIGFNQFA